MEFINLSIMSSANFEARLLDGIQNFKIIIIPPHNSVMAFSPLNL